MLPDSVTIKRLKAPSGGKKIMKDDGSSRTLHKLQEGCYYLRWVQPTSNPRFTFIGTMRVETHGEGVTASADLYSHLNWRVEFNPSPVRKFFPEPTPSADIPVFPREDYAFYLRITEILETHSRLSMFTLRFERVFYDVINQMWVRGGEYRAEMIFNEKTPEGYPLGSTYLHGNIYDDTDRWAGILTMGWISSYLRKATVEIDRSPVSESPVDNGDGVTWRSVFRACNWDLTVDESDANLVEPSGESWSMAELHSTMLERRDSADLDNEWRYHLLCVRELDFTSRGVMYDAFEWDTNNNPREGAAISSHWTIPNATVWGDVAGERFGASKEAYFRTAVHEIGHAMGLYHNTGDNGFMNATNAIAASPGIFPRNIQWSFNPADVRRLRHLPDPWVRPGMMRFGQRYSSVPISPVDERNISSMFTLDVNALLPVVPVGAPVRVKITLRNQAGAVLLAPNSLSLKSGHVDGIVRAPSGCQRFFSSVAVCMDQDEPKPLKPGEEITNDLTLIRGQGHPLFIEAGRHTVEVKVRWKENENFHQVTGRGAVMITPATTETHAQAALKILSTPDILQTIAIGGDHLKEGLEALKLAMADEVLAPHYAVIEAKRYARPFHSRKADPKAAIEVLRKRSVMSTSEAKRIKSLISQAGGKLDSTEI